MHGEGGHECRFCDLDTFRGGDLFIESEWSFYGSTNNADETLPGSGIICPKAHRETPFELRPDEWVDTQAVLVRAKAAIDQRWRPDGYNLIWNVGPVGGQEVAHVHLHLVPRFGDEPFAGRGARWHLKHPDNRRPDPSAPGRSPTTA